MTPSTAQTPSPLVIETSRSIFDLDTKDYVVLVKQGTFSPVAAMSEFVSRLGNDSAKILTIVNDGLQEFERKALATSDSPWMVKAEDGALQPFTGTQISEEKAKQLGATVLNMAKLMFGYDAAAEIKDPEERSKARKASKDAALQMVLGNPAAVEALKK